MFEVNDSQPFWFEDAAILSEPTPLPAPATARADSGPTEAEPAPATAAADASEPAELIEVVDLDELTESSVGDEAYFNRCWTQDWELDVVAARRRPPHQRHRRRRAVLRIVLPLAVFAIFAGAVALIGRPTPSDASARVIGRHATVPGRVTTAPHSPASAFALRTIPAHFLRLYWQAADEYGINWSYLAAVGTLESDNGRSKLAGVRSGSNAAGAAGPAQILESTWQRYGVNVEGSAGRSSRYDAADAITTMAAYLKASGAPEDWAGALYTYDHSTTYVDAVLSLAARYRG